jgi:hypothetical protein
VLLAGGLEGDHQAEHGQRRAAPDGHHQQRGRQRQQQRRHQPGGLDQRARGPGRIEGEQLPQQAEQGLVRRSRRLGVAGQGQHAGQIRAPERQAEERQRGQPHRQGGTGGPGQQAPLPPPGQVQPERQGCQLHQGQPGQGQAPEPVAPGAERQQPGGVEQGQEQVKLTRGHLGGEGLEAGQQHEGDGQRRRAQAAGQHDQPGDHQQLEAEPGHPRRGRGQPGDRGHHQGHGGRAVAAEGVRVGEAERALLGLEPGLAQPLVGPPLQRQAGRRVVDGEGVRLAAGGGDHARPEAGQGGQRHHPDHHRRRPAARDAAELVHGPSGPRPTVRTLPHRRRRWSTSPARFAAPPPTGAERSPGRRPRRL